MDNKETFIVSFMSQFIASWAGHNYDDYCCSGRSGDLCDNMPVEDAEFLAQQAYRIIIKQKKETISKEDL